MSDNKSRSAIPYPKQRQQQQQQSSLVADYTHPIISAHILALF